MRKGKRSSEEEEEEQKIYRGWGKLSVDMFHPIFFSPKTTVEDVLLRARKGLIYLWLIDPELALRIMEKRTLRPKDDPKYMSPDIFERISARGPRLERIWRTIFAWKYARQPEPTDETNVLWDMYTEFMPNRYLRCVAWLCFKVLKTRGSLRFRSPQRNMEVVWMYGEEGIVQRSYELKNHLSGFGFYLDILDPNPMSEGDFATLSLALTAQWLSTTPYKFVEELPTRYDKLLVPCFYLLLKKKWRYEYKTMEGIEKKVL